MVEIPPMRDVLAIVGSTDWTGAEEDFVRAQALIAHTLTDSRPDKVISGGAHGIDAVAIAIAKAMGIPTQEFPPRFRRWAPNGFKARNIVIVQECTRLVVIRSSVSKTYGSGWTADLAERRGKPVERYVL